ncbi:MAG TPA: glutaredoxin family protein [Candidatus Limnocylindrales bacterium]|nr:glutaredoxin family protein [Candidatus Limnocylindrales bacterium]
MSEAALPDLVLYWRPDCHLCHGTRETIGLLFEERTDLGLPVPRLVERDISTDPALDAAFGARIPVVELGDRRLELVTSAGRLRRLLADVLG